MPYARRVAPDRVVQRIRSRLVLDEETGCLLWPGALTNGYGRVGWHEAGRPVYGFTHRIMYEADVGPIPGGMDLDHLCHDPSVCQPAIATDCPHRRCGRSDHLEPATRQTNLLRGGTVAAARAAILMCPQGHLYDETNTIIDRLGRRQCRACNYERNRAYYWAHRERRKEQNKAWRDRQAMDRR